MKRRAIRLLILAVTLSALGLASAGPLTVAVQAKPAFMDRYNKDPYSKPELRNKCTVCHIGRGGGERNDFGEEFADAGYRITPKLRKQFPALFVSEKEQGSEKGGAAANPENRR
ncbi:MAG TPA: hypothetical protein VFD58_19425 [Blastocatellia bacterium]|nr:hypothetical protein [Blastocatellia bacterium]